LTKRTLTAAMVMLMILGTTLAAVPVHAVINPLPVLGATSGPAGSAQTIRAPATLPAVTVFPGGHDVFVLFDKAVADADLGQTLYPFGAVAGPPAGTEMYARMAPVPPWPAVYIPGDPIYRDTPGIGVGVVSLGDVRETPVTASAATGSVVYTAGSTVAPGDADFGIALFAVPPNTMHTAASAAVAAAGFNWATDGIYVRDASNIVAGFNNHVGPGDVRAKYPGVTVTLANTGLTYSYAAWTKVYSPIFDFQKPIYNHVGGAGVPQQVVPTDTRLRNVALSQVRYATGSAVLAGSADAVTIGAAILLAFSVAAPFEAFADVNDNGLWGPGEWIYRVPAGPFPGFVVPGNAVRLSYVAGVTPAGAAFSYEPLSAVAAGDFDVGTPIRLFPLGQSYYDADLNGAYSYGEWIYNQAVGMLVTTGATSRASPVDYTDKGMAGTGTLSTILPAAWNPAVEWSNIVGYPAGSAVVAGNGDVGRPLTRFTASDKHTGAAAYVSGNLIYRDSDNDFLISVGDTREVLVSRIAGLFGARAYTSPWPWAGRTGLTATPPVADNAFWYMPGTTVVGAPTADVDLVGAPIVSFAATEYYYDEFSDGSYLGGDLVAHGGTNGANGVAQPFPVNNAPPGPAGPVAIQFTVPNNAGIGNHAILIMDDHDAASTLGVPFANAGFQAAATFMGGTFLFEALPWFVGNAVAVGYTTTSVAGSTPMDGHAAPAFFVVTVPVRVFLRPGVRDEYKPGWSHTLDTLRGTQGGVSQFRQIIDRYPDYAILASASDSIGDFQFDFQVFAPISDIRIYVPSNFTFAYTSSGYGDATTSDKIYSVWTDITNDYSYISVRALGLDDPIAPDWQLVEIGRLPIAGSLLPSFMIVPGLYHIRLFQIRAPFTAGLYHFKIYVNGISIGAGNFPIIIVKSGLNPAYVTGLVELRGLAAAMLVSGRVVASGTTSIGKYAEAVAYFGPPDFVTADAAASYYRYWLFGLPAGVYDLTASASGYLKASSRVTVADGQSLRCDFELERGVEIRVTVWSKDTNGPIPWGNLWQLPYGTNNPYLPIDNAGHHRDILFRLLNQYEESVGYWGSDDIDPPYGPPWTLLTIDGKRDYSPLLLKSSTLPSSDSYTVTLTDSRGLPSARLDGHVPADTADLVEGIATGFYTVEIQVTGYVMAGADDWQRSFTISSNPGTYSLEVDLRRTSWLMATAEISNAASAPLSSSTIVFVAKSTDNLDKGLAAGTFPAGAMQFMMVLEGFNGIYNLHRASTDYQDYGFEPVDFTLDVYMADVGTPYTGFRGMGWYLLEEEPVDFHIGYGAFADAVSFHLDACSIEFVLRSMHLQQPMQLAPWTFPGAGIRLLLFDEYGNMTGILDPSFYGLVQDDGTILGDPYDIDTTAIGRHGLLRVLFTGIDPGPVSALGGVYPTSIDEGIYHVAASTLGYIQVRDATISVRPGVSNDLSVDLVQGAQIRVELEFRHENLATAFNGFVRVEVYNQDGALVGASIYSGAQPNPNLSYYLPYNALEDWKLVHGAAEGAGTGAQPQRGFISLLYYGIPPATWANYPMMIPSDANRLSVPQGSIAAFDVFGFHGYYGGQDSRNEKLWANGWETTNGIAHADSGIRGSLDVQELEGWGNFTVRVWAFDPYGPDGVFEANGPDGIFGTDDDYTSSDLVDGGLSDFRAYAQTAEITNIEAPWGGATVVHATLEEQPSVLGVISWIDMYGNLRTLPWAQIIETSYDGTWASSATGRYRLWLSLSGGPHEFYVTTIGEEQLWEDFQSVITVAGPGDHTFRDITLRTSGVATPEFGAPIWGAAITLSALSIILSRRRSKNTKGS
jgi:hypothetical protein